MKTNLLGAKVSVFQQDQINYHRKLSQRSYLAQTLIKHKTTSNQRLDEIFILKQNLKSKNKNKIGLPANKRYCLTPLARHKTRIDLSIVIFGMQFLNYTLMILRIFFSFINDQTPR